MRKKVLLLTLAFCTMCAGCSKKDNKDNNLVEEYNQINVSSNSDADKNDLAVIPENIEFRSKKLGINVVADVNSDGYRDVKLYEASKKNLNDSFFRQFSDDLFDRGSVEIMIPYEVAPFEYIENQIDYFNQLDDAALAGNVSEDGDGTEDDETETQGTLKVPTALREEVEMAKKKYWDDQEARAREDIVVNTVKAKLSYALLNISENSGNTTECIKAKIRGNYSGKPYEIDYLDDGFGNRNRLTVYSLTPHYVEANDVIEVESTEEINNFGSNLCDESYAKSASETFLTKMGCGDFVEIASEQRLCFKDEELTSFCYDGYKKIYARQIEGINTIVAGNYGQDLIDSAGNWQSTNFFLGTQEYIIVDVDHTGVVEVEYSSFFDKGRVLAEDVTLLPFNNIMEIISERPIFYMTTADDTVLNVDIKLAYAPLSYDGTMAYVPMWTVIAKDTAPLKAGADSTPVLAINAIDGSCATYEGHIGYTDYNK